MEKFIGIYEDKNYKISFHLFLFNKNVTILAKVSH